MPKPRELDRELERFLEALPDGGEALLCIADMVGAIVKLMRHRQDSASVSSLLREQGFTDEQLNEHIVPAMAFVARLPHELWRFD